MNKGTKWRTGVLERMQQGGGGGGGVYVCVQDFVAAPRISQCLIL